MKLNNIELYDLFVEKGITHVYHANSVATAITFIENKGLLSRGYVEKYNLTQTYQSSDEDDKKFDVWYDVFIDTVDLHEWFRRQNLYGPVLFKFSVNCLLDSDLDIWVTKNNPIYWHSRLLDSEKYFQSVHELRKFWDDIECQKRMITIRKPGTPILFNHLEEILVDNPNVIIFNEINLWSEAVEALKNATESVLELRPLFNPRSCHSCYCQSNYLNQVSIEQLFRLFLPKSHEKYPD